jgi:hypothetical protein
MTSSLVGLPTRIRMKFPRRKESFLRFTLLAAEKYRIALAQWPILTREMDSLVLHQEAGILRPALSKRKSVTNVQRQLQWQLLAYLLNVIYHVHSSAAATK